MGTARLRSESRTPSPLEVDLAKATVDLATLRARRGLEVDQEALDAADLLKRYYFRQLRMATSPGPKIPEAMVEDEETRQTLQKGLASIYRARPSFDKASEPLVKRLLEVLRTLAVSREWPREVAQEAHTVLHRLEPKRTSRSSSSKLAKLSESLDVS